MGIYDFYRLALDARARRNATFSPWTADFDDDISLGADFTIDGQSPGDLL